MFQPRRHAVVFTLFALLMAALVLPGAGCKGKKLDPISRILADPNAFYDRDVTVAGRVTRVFDPTQGLLNLSAYQIDDGSGKIWVVSRTGAPNSGQEVGLKGRVRTDFRLGNELLGAVLTEIERRTR